MRSATLDTMPIEQRLTAIVPLVLALLCCTFLARPRVGYAGVVAAGLLVVSVAVWSQVQKVYEGPTVVPLTGARGLTVADLVIVPSLGIAAAVVARARR